MDLLEARVKHIACAFAPGHGLLSCPGDALLSEPEIAPFSEFDQFIEDLLQQTQHFTAAECATLSSSSLEQTFKTKAEESERKIKGALLAEFSGVSSETQSDLHASTVKVLRAAHRVFSSGFELNRCLCENHKILNHFKCQRDEGVEFLSAVGNASETTMEHIGKEMEARQMAKEAAAAGGTPSPPPPLTAVTTPSPSTAVLRQNAPVHVHTRTENPDTDPDSLPAPAPPLSGDGEAEADSVEESDGYWTPTVLSSFEAGWITRPTAEAQAPSNVMEATQKRLAEQDEEEEEQKKVGRQDRHSLVRDSLCLRGQGRLHDTEGEEGAQCEASESGNLATWSPSNSGEKFNFKKAFHHLASAAVRLLEKHQVGTHARSVWDYEGRQWESEELRRRGDTLHEGQHLGPGQALISGNGRYKWVLQHDNWMHGWDRHGGGFFHVKMGSGGHYEMHMQRDCNLVIYRAVMQSDRNFVLYNGHGHAIWQTGTSVGSEGHFYCSDFHQDQLVSKLGFEVDVALAHTQSLGAEAVNLFKMVSGHLGKIGTAVSALAEKLIEMCKVVVGSGGTMVGYDLGWFVMEGESHVGWTLVDHPVGKVEAVPNFKVRLTSGDSCPQIKMYPGFRVKIRHPKICKKRKCSKKVFGRRVCVPIYYPCGVEHKTVADVKVGPWHLLHSDCRCFSGLKCASSSRGNRPVGAVQVGIFSQNGQKWCADNGPDFICDKSGINGDWERFTMEYEDHLQVSLKGGNQKKNCADQEDRVRCNVDGVGGHWEKFRFEFTDDGWMGIRGQRSNRLCANEGNRLICNRDGLGAWEKFRVVVIGMPSGEYSMKSKRHDHAFCSDEHDKIRCNRSGAGGSWEKWRFEFKGDKVALKGGQHGKYCSDEGSNGVLCNRDGFHSQEEFQLMPMGDRTYALRGARGKFCADDDSNRMVCDRDWPRGPWEQFEIRKL
uniref:Bulb-type lectin domain-containing protein n=1 Tax=Chromera velia CCMP2878 TaxID=1169474 RepID=A0A0G4HLP4_9ALVE|eukprot:Cvel_7385.t1-p1 / transcript=Cvel_7385.t1 / gene=Cvel_7385 / organism=Chromera_velia_CCMP2878 / gene_product=hypothetical protein / transcript_product=hypothetical protein / location=Cvel_scaffold384:66986-76358(+) / protein_length=941 / sequence_SO=supercontig / SO=protein_coding / is_pseudo=false